MLVALPHGHKADIVADALAAKITTLPAALTRTLTWDQGDEIAEPARFTQQTRINVYFCDPSRPGGTARIRTPTGSSANPAPHPRLQTVTKTTSTPSQRLNGRPRQTLGFRPMPSLAECCVDRLNPHRCPSSAHADERAEHLPANVAFCHPQFMKALRLILAAALLTVMTGCGSHSAEKQAAAALAVGTKCQSRFAQQFHLQGGTKAVSEGFVSDLGKGRFRVTGNVPTSAGLDHAESTHALWCPVRRGCAS